MRIGIGSDHRGSEYKAARITFMVHGAEKAPALKAVPEGPYEPDQLPAQIIKPKEGKVLLLVDPTAAAMLAPQAKRAF